MCARQDLSDECHRQVAKQGLAGHDTGVLALSPLPTAVERGVHVGHSSAIVNPVLMLNPIVYPSLNVHHNVPLASTLKTPRLDTNDPSPRH